MCSRCLLTLVLLTAVASPCTAGLHASLLHSLTRVHPEERAEGSGRLHLSAARNEWEGFQVLVTAEGNAQRGVSARATGLRGPGGAHLHAPRLYREHYVRVTEPTYRSKEPPAWWPDALIPLSLSEEDRAPVAPRFRGAPFDVEPGRNQPLYGEVFVPASAAPGEYHGSVIVSAEGEAPRRLELALTVWPITLPASPACQSNFGGFGRAILRSGEQPGSPEAIALARRYEKALISHRVMPSLPTGAVPPAGPDGTPDTATVEPVLREYFETLKANSLQVPLPIEDPIGRGRARAVRYLREYYRFLEARGWADMAYTYLLDEPNDAEAYELTRRLAALVHEAEPRLRFLCTEQTITSDLAWGDLVGAVDIWCPLWALWDEPTARIRLHKGDRLWSYTALCQGGAETPFWQLDFPLLNYRVALWQNWVTGCTGLLYWTTVYWEKAGDPWTNPRTYNQFNGEGMLFYPGEDAGVKGPVASLRLKALRDGFEDYDLCAILASRRGRQQADAIAREVARGWRDWEKDPEAIFRARVRAANAILGRSTQ